MKYQINNTRELVYAFADYTQYSAMDFEDFSEDLQAYVDYCKALPGVYLPILKVNFARAFVLYCAAANLDAHGANQE